ncbi:MAG: O-antigen ligase family protein [Verrucomicrobiota bacterium]
MTTTAAQIDNVRAEEDTRFPVLSAKLPQLLYYAVIFSIPFFRFRQISGAAPFLKVDWLLVMALAAIVAPYLFIRKSVPRSFASNIWPWFALFFIVNLSSSLLSPYPNAAFSGIVLLLIDFAFISINLLMVDRRGFRTIMPLVLAIAVTLNAVLACLGYFLNVAYFRAGGRGIGGTIGANNAAVMGIFVLPLIMHWIWNSRKTAVTNVAIVALVINILGIISTESRAGFLNMMLILALSLYTERHRFHPRFLGIVMAGAGIIVMVAILAVPEQYIARQSTILEGTQADVSTQRRAAYIDVGIRSFLHHPIIGTGTQTFSQVWVNSQEALRFKREERGAHNTYIEVAVGSGLLGLAFFGMLLLQCLMNYTKAVHLYREADDAENMSLAKAYRLSFVSVLIYFLFKSGLDHKMFLLAIPLSQTALNLARQDTLQNGQERTTQ